MGPKKEVVGNENLLNKGFFVRRGVLNDRIKGMACGGKGEFLATIPKKNSEKLNEKTSEKEEIRRNY
jgi:hypothetical protein